MKKEEQDPKIEIELSKYLKLISAKLRLDKLCQERKQDLDIKNQGKKEEN